MGNEESIRENFKLPKSVSEKFAELAAVMDKSKTELLIYMIDSEYERREKLLEAYHKAQESLKELRK